MQGVSKGEPELLDAAALVGHLVPAGSVFAFLAEHRREVFRDDAFADLFPSGTGRPSIPADVIGSVLLLQALYDYSDPQVVEALRCDIRWKVACGLPLTYEGFDPSTLVYWRKRLAASARPHRIHEAIDAVIAQTGVLKGRRKRALDSTILADAVATQDTVTQLIAAIRRVGRQVPGAAEAIAAQCTGADYSTPAKPKIDWDDPQARDELVSALVNDATRLVEIFTAEQVDLTGKQADAVGLLALVAGQDVEPAEGGDGTDGRWRIARRVAEDRVISVHDPQARHTRKTPEARRDGYRAHIAVEPDTTLITGCALTQATGAAGSDAAVAGQMLTADTHAQNEPVTAYGDSAYGTGELRAALAGAGHTAIIKPKPLKPAVEGGFTLDDFTVDETAATVTCPNGVTRPITPKRNVTFGVACRGCPLRTRCTTSKTGRALILHPHDALLRQARAAWAGDPSLRRAYDADRPQVERAICWVATCRGRRLKLRYIGTAKNDWWLRTRVAGLNLRRLLNLGLTRRPGTWALA
ncbi:IS1182 family transposase [Actinomadura sp. NBRC 104412]|uniref:IS1182 family transposase n=1 Tax=Actinomadura sp. NBRC 104412 TaxID=3032203 RepID=UPI0025562D66|nr:IS1182 family transposase [Actinomadura sp. NBRC 104412]